jgi:hypothetical protein
MHTIEETKNQEAAEYATGIVENLETLQLLVDAWDELEAYVDADEDDDFEEKRDDLLDLAGDAAALNAVVSLYRELDYGRGLDDAREAVDRWVESLLGVDVRGSYSGGSWIADEVTFLVTFGGPTCRIIWDGSPTLTVECSWWSAPVTRRIECVALSDWAEGFAASIC